MIYLLMYDKWYVVFDRKIHFVTIQLLDLIIVITTCLQLYFHH